MSENQKGKKIFFMLIITCDNLMFSYVHLLSLVHQAITKTMTQRSQTPDVGRQLEQTPI